MFHGKTRGKGEKSDVEIFFLVFFICNKVILFILFIFAKGHEISIEGLRRGRQAKKTGK